MSFGLSWSMMEDIEVGQDNKAHDFMARYSAGQLARYSLIFAEDSEHAVTREDEDALILKSGAFASMAVMRKMIDDGEIDPVRELPEFPDHVKAILEKANVQK